MNVQFEILIESGDDAIVSDPQAEVSRILKRIDQDVCDQVDAGLLYDVNGNKIGNWFLEIDDDD